MLGPYIETSVRRWVRLPPLPLVPIRATNSSASCSSSAMISFVGGRLSSRTRLPGARSHLATWGEGFFRKILGAGIESAQNRGGQLVIGFPNSLSEGVMTHGAGFSSAGKFRRVVIPRFLTRLPSFFLRRGANEWLAAESIEQNNAQLFEWKRADRGPQIIRVACGGNCLWGRLQLKQIGSRTVSSFRVGGMMIPRVGVLPWLLRAALRETGADVLDLMFQSTSEFSQLLRFHHFAEKSEGLFVLPLVSDFSLENFDLWVGAKDTF